MTDTRTHATDNTQTWHLAPGNIAEIDDAIDRDGIYAKGYFEAVDGKITCVGLRIGTGETRIVARYGDRVARHSDGTWTTQPAADIRALTIRQPWAGAIAHQTKRVENRTWKLPAKHHGARILIHAGAQPDRDAIVYGDHLDVYSAVVAIATLTDCHWSDDGTCCGPWGLSSSYHWTLTDVLALPTPVTDVKGRLGIWTPNSALLDTVTAQLAAA